MSPPWVIGLLILKESFLTNLMIHQGSSKSMQVD